MTGEFKVNYTTRAEIIDFTVRDWSLAKIETRRVKADDRKALARTARYFKDKYGIDMALMKEETESILDPQAEFVKW